MNTSEALKELGLSQKEADLYLVSLQIGSATIFTLSRAANMHRPIVYKLVDQLIAKGVMKISLDGKRRVYVATNPKDLVQIIKNKESALSEVLPELLALASSGSKRAKVLYFEGRDRLKDLFRTGLEAKSKSMYSYFPSKYMIELFGKREMEQIIDERIKRKIEVKTLRSRLSEEEFVGSEKTEEAYRQFKYLPDDQNLQMGIVIFDNKVNLFSPIKENFGLQIESEAFSQIMKYMFENLWQQSSGSPLPRG